MEELPEKTAKCPFCSYRFTTDVAPAIRSGSQIHPWTCFAFLCAGVAILGFLYLFLTQEEPRLSETAYLKYLTENLTITGQEYSNLDVLFGQIIEDPPLRQQKDWQARVAFTQKRITETAAKIGSVPPKLVPLKPVSRC
jgi:hypothetical protein